MEDLIQAVETLRPPDAVASAPRMDGKQSARLTPSIALASIWLAMTPAFGQSTAPDGGGASLGRWLIVNGNLEIEIAPCGAALLWHGDQGIGHPLDERRWRDGCPS